MDDSYSSSRTPSASFSHPRKEPEVTLDDVAEVVASLNKKVLQLRKEILGLRDSPRSERAKGREGHDIREDRKSQMTRDRYESYEEDYVPRRRRKPSSRFIRKESNLRGFKDFHRKSTDRTSSTVSLSEDLDTIKPRRSKQPEARKLSYVHGKRRHKSVVQVDRDEFAVSGRMKNRRATSESSSKILSDESRDKTEGTNSNARRKSITSGEIMDEKLARSNRKYSYPSKNSDNDFREILKNFNRLKNNEDLQKQSLNENETTRIVLPSRMSANCQGIRHAFGLSTDFCNCDAAGSAVRRVRRKRISRGVQCLIDNPNKNKNRRYCGLGGCFAFKCSSPKNKLSSRRKIAQDFPDKEKSLESSEMYKPKNNTREKEASESRENATEPSHELKNKKTLINARISGGADQNKSQKCRQSKMYAPMHFEIPARARCQQRKSKSVADQTSQKNDVADVKRRLTKCLIELNGIIGDVNYMFEETKQHC